MDKTYYMLEPEVYFGWDSDGYIVGNEPPKLPFGRKIVLKNDTLFSSGGSHEVFLNKMPVTSQIYPVRTGDLLECAEWECYIQKGYLEFKIKEEGKIFLQPVAGPHIPKGFPQYTRSPRVLKELEKQKIEIAKPKELRSLSKTKLWMLILPPLAMITAMSFMCFFLRNALFLVIAGVTSTATIIVSVSRYVSDKKEGRQDSRIREESYLNYLDEKRAYIYRTRQEELRIDGYNYPKSTDILQMAEQYSRRIYEKQPLDNDFLSISLGTGLMPSEMPISLRRDEIETTPDPLIKRAEAIQNGNRYLKKPVVVSTKDSHLGLIGDLDIIRAQAMHLVLQMSLFHSYHDIRFIVMTNTAEFEWMTWLPHTWFAPAECYGIINSERTRDLVLTPLYDILKERDKLDLKKKRPSPHFVIINDNTEWCTSHPVMDYIGKRENALGFTYICLAKSAEYLTENIGTEAKFYDKSHGELLLMNRSERHLHFEAQPRLSTKVLDDFARQLSALEHVQGVAAQIPKKCTFFELYGRESVEDFNIGEMWAAHNVNRSLAAPIGLRSKDDIFCIDMHEDAHGPHGLIAGTTGSGKSELLQTFILSLACCYHPYEVAFLLIDYKGGGMANLFSSLPHVLGLITNLDGDQTTRTMKSIRAELDRRQHLFNELEVNNINNYTIRFRNGDTSEPLPHLFIISDEFAELKKEQPDFMKELVSAARVGRSLGVHLILATQKPSGIIDDQIRSNMHTSIALRTASESDSKEVLGTGDAAFITNPGRACIKIGTNELYDMLQTAWSGAPYAPDTAKGKSASDHTVYLINEIGQRLPLRRQEQKREDIIEDTELQVLSKRIEAYFKSTGLPKAKAPWLPPLPAHIVKNYTDHYRRESAYEMPLIPLGIVDIPEEQKMTEYVHSFHKDGHIMYVGAAGSGKTTFLSSIALSIAATCSPKQAWLYILDFGNGGLASFKELHHTAGYITANDEERLTKFKKLLMSEMEYRQQLLVDTNTPSITAYNNTSTTKVSTIYVLIDNMEALYEINAEMASELTRVCQTGAGLDIFFAVTGNRLNAIRYNMQSNFKVRLAGTLVDESEASSIVGKTEYHNLTINGRARIWYQDAVQLIQCYEYADAENEMNRLSVLRQIFNTLNDRYGDARAPQIPTLPEYFPHTLLPKYTGATKDIYVGLDEETVSRCGFNRENSPFLIMGEAGRGKKNILAVLLNQLKEKKETVYLFDSRGMPFYDYSKEDYVHYSGNKEQAQANMQELSDISDQRKEKYDQIRTSRPDLSPNDTARSLDPIWIVINEWDDFIDNTVKNGASPAVITNVFEVLKLTGCAIIASSNTGKLKGYDDVSKFIKNSVDGLLLGTQGTHSIYSMPITLAQKSPPFKFGHLFINGERTLVKIPVYKESKRRRTDIFL